MNNRQNNRRRGRNPNPRQSGGGRGADPQNRIDNRTRGNAVQLHEKYRNMARDAQTKGDRVEAEYWWQFADHYYRVVADQRARAEERQGGGRSQRDEWRAQAEDDDDRQFSHQPGQGGNGRDDGSDGDDWRQGARGGSQGHGGEARNDRSSRPQSNGPDEGRPYEEDGERQVRSDAPDDGQAQRPRRVSARSDEESGQTDDRQDESADTSTRRPRRSRPVEAAISEDEVPVKRPRGRPRKVVDPDAQLDSAVLPPSLKAEGDAPKRPRGRPRKVVDEDTAAA